MWLPLLGFLVGFVLFYVTGTMLPDPNIAKYMAVAILSGVDTVIGGIRAHIEDKFDDWVFISGFFVNAFLAAGLTWVGDQLGVDLAIAAYVVFGKRIFDNLAILRRHLLNYFQGHQPAKVESEKLQW
jgi:small basic protein